MDAPVNSFADGTGMPPPLWWRLERLPVVIFSCDRGHAFKSEALPLAASIRLLLGRNAFLRVVDLKSLLLEAMVSKLRATSRTIRQIGRAHV